MFCAHTDVGLFYTAVIVVLTPVAQTSEKFSKSITSKEFDKRMTKCENELKRRKALFDPDRAKFEKQEEVNQKWVKDTKARYGILAYIPKDRLPRTYVPAEDKNPLVIPIVDLRSDMFLNMTNMCV